MAVTLQSKPMIANVNYHDPLVLDTELARLFRAGWQFVAMQDELASEHDFVCLDLPDDSIVVQNFKGELRAFRNVCTHRFNLIQTADRGNRPLMCGYHAWTFDANGMPLGKGERQGFIALREERERLCLTRYQVETCGRFVFVARNANAPSLVGFLGPFAKLLRELSDYMGTQTYFGGVAHAANWKLLVENVLECYHCSTVHPQTFVEGLGVGREPIRDVEIAHTPGGVHSSSHFPRVPIKREALRRKLVSHLDGRAFAHDSFFHVHIFPNLFISSTEGTNFYVGHAIPRAAQATQLRIRFFEPAVELSPSDRVRQDAINTRSVPLGRRVIEEDRAILETVQRGITIADRLPALGNEEVRIAAFHSGYQRMMTDDDADTPVSARPPSEAAWPAARTS